MKQFNKGGYVRHKNLIVNGGVPMLVKDVKDQQVQCYFFYGKNGIDKLCWFSFEDVAHVQ